MMTPTDLSISSREEVSDSEDTDLYERIFQESHEPHSTLENNSGMSIQMLLLEALQREHERSEILGSGRRSSQTTGHVNPDNDPEEEWPAFIGRRPQLRTLLRNLIVLDHILIALLFPFSLFNILRALFSELTFSEYDFYVDILQYMKRIAVVDAQNKSLLLYTDSLGLLVKFHNIVVFYTRNVYSAMSAMIGNVNWTARLYTLFVRLSAISLYLTYGLMTSSYLCFAAFFFTLCFGMTVVKRYKGVERIINQIYRNTEGLF
ncbi:HBR482Cp [Eremothecium sinecaudum]|uniref:HBR482Cp n=1 Tax=Eremothecium sinecaudum TaxID=45286 RepID=A0A109UXJ4_9SACH|nr:HBR482Cp [Eremothecium sinecaudum]AMD19383.1 HBR482Cp [Eremothecium sinecaudum]